MSFIYAENSTLNLIYYVDYQVYPKPNPDPSALCARRSFLSGEISAKKKCIAKMFHHF